MSKEAGQEIVVRFRNLDCTECEYEFDVSSTVIEGPRSLRPTGPTPSPGLGSCLYAPEAGGQ